jgi:casein kinase II subunit alpha
MIKSSFKNSTTEIKNKTISNLYKNINFAFKSSRSTFKDDTRANLNNTNNLNNNNLGNNNSSNILPNFPIKNTKSDPFENVNIHYGKHDDYEVLNRLGSGKYSQVYDGINIVTDKNVVIKVIKPVKYKKIRREVTILNILKGHENIVTLNDVIVDSSSRTPSLVYERINHVDFRILFPKLSVSEIKFYMYGILKGLAFAHSKGIMHRDIKPHNIIIDPHNKLVKIIDWGLAEIYQPNTDYSVRVASRYFKAPELLVDYAFYDYSLDIWSLGCLFAGLIVNKEPFFHGNDNFDQLIKVVKIMGSSDLTNYLKKYDLKLNDQYNGLVEK